MNIIVQPSTLIAHSITFHSSAIEPSYSLTVFVTPLRTRLFVASKTYKRTYISVILAYIKINCEMLILM